MAMFSTYISWQLMTWGLSFWVAFVLAVVISFVLGVLIERVVLRPLHSAPVLSVIVVFIGLLAICNSIAGAIWSYLIKEYPSPFPKSSFGIAGVIGPHQLGVVLVTLIVLTLLFVFFRFTPLGLAMRAAAQNPQMARLVGVRVDWMLALGWGLAASVGAVAGLMVAHIVRAGEHGRLRRQPDREGHRRLHHRQRREAHCGADHRHLRADGEAGRPVRPRHREEGMTCRPFPRSC
jgi:branched-chain amino acid transport system permease protein